MIEILRHMLGLCGENHPSLIWLFASGTAVVSACWIWLKSKFYVIRSDDETS